MSKLSRIIAATMMTSLALGAFSVSLVALSATEVAAKGGQSSGAGKARGKANRGGARGAIAKELKNLNAMCANENAFANASSESNIGLMAAFYSAQQDALGAEMALLDAETVLTDNGEVYDGATAADIVAAIALLDPAVDGEQIEALERQRAYAEASELLAAETAALADAVGDRDISDDALAVFEAGCDA